MEAEETKPEETEETKPRETEETKSLEAEETKPFGPEETTPSEPEEMEPLEAEETKPLAVKKAEPLETEETKPPGAVEPKPSETEETKPMDVKKTQPMEMEKAKVMEDEEETKPHVVETVPKCEKQKSDKDDMSNVYHVKWITWSEQRTPIVTQNENGPCPLLAIFNVLLLSKRITLGSAVEFISSSEIISRIADVIWNNMPENLPEHERLNYEQNISDAMAVFPNLQTGLDVNIKFCGVSSFEYTPELTVFDLLHIPLYHGWLVDPQDKPTAEIVGDLSYNQVVEKVISYNTSDNPDEVNKGLIAHEFLESNASQLTFYGIVSLCEEMQPGSLAVLFRNNHFCTIHRHKDELFTLITDLGFLKEHDVVWESLSSVQGDSHFVDGNFLNSPPKAETTMPSDVMQSTDLDYQLALSIQQDQMDTQPVASEPRTDYELAMHLQRQEEASLSRRGNHPRPTGHTDPSSSNSNKQRTVRNGDQKEDSKCTIL